MFTHEELKAYQRAHRDNFNADANLRIHRALSWLKRAEHETDDLDARFIFYWVAFNAAYAVNASSDYRMTESSTFNTFIERLESSDDKGLFHHILWSNYPNAIRLLLQNKFVYQPFWDAHSQVEYNESWSTQLEKANQAANKALGAQDVAKTLSIILSRLYTLRNQLIHGGATWNSKVNRGQLRDACAILGELMPTIIYIMMNNAQQVWGTANYPVVEG